MCKLRWLMDVLYVLHEHTQQYHKVLSSLRQCYNLRAESCM